MTGTSPLLCERTQAPYGTMAPFNFVTKSGFNAMSNSYLTRCGCELPQSSKDNDCNEGSCDACQLVNTKVIVFLTSNGASWSGSFFGVNLSPGETRVKEANKNQRLTLRMEIECLFREGQCAVVLMHVTQSSEWSRLGSDEFIALVVVVLEEGDVGAVPLGRNVHVRVGRELNVFADTFIDFRSTRGLCLLLTLC
jgi:hypothetical protein